MATSTVKRFAPATASADGLMSASDKTKLDGLTVATQTLTKTFGNPLTVRITKQWNTIGVELNCDSTVNIGTSWVSLGTLNANVRPSRMIKVSIGCVGGQTVVVQIMSGGAVTIIASAAGSFWAQGGGATVI